MKILNKFIYPLFLLLISISSSAYSKDYIIYSIDQEVPSGKKDEVIKKNFYLNIGSIQGISNGDLVNVYRRISKSNPYENNKQHQYSLKVGQLRIIHTQEYASIGILEKLYSNNLKSTIVHNSSIMIRDQIDLYIKKN